MNKYIFASLYLEADSPGLHMELIIDGKLFQDFFIKMNQDIASKFADYDTLFSLSIVA